MSDYQHSVDILAPPQDVYEYVSNPDNFPAFLPTLRNAEAKESGAIEMSGQVEGHPYKTRGEFHLDPDERAMHWGSESSEYHGQLQVTGDGLNSQLSVKISFADGSDTEEKIRQRSEGSTPIQDALIHALEAVKQQCETASAQRENENRGYLG